MMLEANGLCKVYGGVRAVDGVSLQAEAGTITGLVGANGAGKTTCFNLLSGFEVPTSGQVYLNGVDITGLRPDQRVREGLVRTFQHTSLFFELTAFENVEIAFHKKLRRPFWRTMAPVSHARGSLESEVVGLLGRVGLADVADVPAAKLPYGLQRRLGVAVALAVSPTFILLDEPAAGLNPGETHELGTVLLELAHSGVGVFIVEHDMSLIMRLSNRIYVMNSGRVLAEGSAQEIRNDPSVAQVYLGSRT